MLKYFKKYDLIDYLIFLYVFFLPFIKIGIVIIHYTFSISDFILIIILFRYLVYIYKKGINLFNINKSVCIFISLYGLFFISILMSTIWVKNINNAIAEVLAYLYAFGVIIAFTLYLFEKQEHGVFVVFMGFVYVSFVVAIFSLTGFLPIDIKKIFYDSTKYRFLMVKTSQLAMFLLISFGIYLISINYLMEKIRHNIILNILFPPLVTIAIFFTQSRTATFVSAIFLLYFYIRYMNLWNKKVFLFMFAFFLSLLIYFIIKPPDYIKRAISVFYAISKGEYIDNIRVIMFKRAIEIFIEHPFFGVGLGNFKGNYFTHEAHNTILALLSQTGMIGTIPFIIFVGWYFVTVVFKFTKNIYKRLDYLIIFGGLFVYHMEHYVLRERWNWVFFVYILFFSYLLYKGKIKIDKNN